MSFCSRCGSDVSDKNFCENCGENVDARSVELYDIEPHEDIGATRIAESESRRKSQMRNLVLLLGAIAIAFLASTWANVFDPTGEITHSNDSSLVSKSSENLATESEFKASCLAISYEQLARYPDEREGLPLVTTGKVVQVLDNGDSNGYRIAVDNNYDQVIYAEYDGSFSQGKILENDVVTFWGNSDGLMSYRPTIGGKTTIPSMIAKYHQIN